jgi:hypothetical protein
MTPRHLVWWTRAAAAAALLASSSLSAAARREGEFTQAYQYEDTRALVELVADAAALVRSDGESAFADFRVDGSRWRQGETYVFVLDPDGTMLVHPDPTMEGRNQIALKDIVVKPII